MIRRTTITIITALCLLIAVACAQAQISEFKITANDGDSGDWFGYSVAISGNLAIVGAEWDDNDNGTKAGAIYIFEHSGGSWNQMQKLTANDGAANDNFGNSVAISGDLAIVGAYQDDDNGADAGAAYIFMRNAGSWSQVQKLTASDGSVINNFGNSVAISGDLAIVGAPFNTNDNGGQAGAAYIFQHSGSSWAQVQKLMASGANADYFGLSVAISGDLTIVGASFDDNENGTDAGASYIFDRNGGSWSQQQKLTASDAGYDHFGNSVAISGDAAIVGAYQDDDNGPRAGAAYVFEHSGGSWSLQQKLIASDGSSDDYFGCSVAISGDLTIVGAFQDDNTNGTNAGAAYIFERSNDSWIEQHKLIASDGASDDYFGYPVAISGDAAIVGAYRDDDNGLDSGATYIFTNVAGPPLNGDFSATPLNGDAPLTVQFTDTSTGNPTIWQWDFDNDGTIDSNEQNPAWTYIEPGTYTVSLTVSNGNAQDTEVKGDHIAVTESELTEFKITASDGAANSEFGNSVAISGDLAIVAAPWDSNDNEDYAVGAAYIFEYSGGSWIQQQKLTANDGAAYDGFGFAVAIFSDLAIIGAPGDDDNGNHSGAAYVFERSGNNWIQQQKLTASYGVSYDDFGEAVAISSDLVIVGASGDDDNGPASGAAYIFYWDGSSWVEQQKLTASDGGGRLFWKFCCDFW
ncbi:MAG: hypothetical protein B6244_05530 [Candidatus Cloacimonetes bacterium 4572_55]|nr:MAG: hypothetical protein B6244_05530 [Candidatus Cloacimonetes bacterium 4572_55]